SLIPTPKDPRYSTANYSYRTAQNCSAKYLEKVEQVIESTPLSLEEIDRNEFNIHRRLTLDELDLLATAAYWAIYPDITNKERIIELLKEPGVEVPEIETHCKICGDKGETKCTREANCLNVPLNRYSNYR
ncbi:MAG: hypothetical protein ACK4ON_12485, partial [Bacteroidia bacterium]